MLHQITSLILSYFIRPRHIELPEHEEAPLNEESIASEDSDIEILGEKIKLHHYPITNDYHLITNHQRSYQNSIFG